MKPTLILLALVSLASSAICLPRIATKRGSSNVVIQPATIRSCVDRYNDLLEGAKAALIKGDRVASVELLQQAENVIPGCPALQDGTMSQTALLALNTRFTRAVN
jgi:hypothetical protein